MNPRQELIHSIAKDSLEQELLDFQQDRAGYLDSVGVLIAQDKLDVLPESINIPERCVNALTKRLLVMVKNMADNEAVEYLSENTVARDTIIDAFLGAINVK